MELGTPHPIPLATSTQSNQSPSLSELLKVISTAKFKPSTTSLPPSETALILEARLTSYLQSHPFSRGQLVKWKQGLKNRARPDYGQPAIVIEVLTGQHIDGTNDSGSPYYREPLNLILGTLAPEDGGFVIYHFDISRFEPFNDTTA